MPKRIAVIAAFGLLGSLYSIDAQAFPTSFLAKNVAWSRLWYETYPDQLVMNGLQRATGK